MDAQDQWREEMRAVSREVHEMWQVVAVILGIAGLLGWLIFNVRACDTTARTLKAEVEKARIEKGCPQLECPAMESRSCAEVRWP